MSPQLVDFDADGINDLLMGTFEGVAFLVPGTREGYGEPEYILDSAGRTILLSAFWNHEEKKWDNADRSPQGVRHAQDHCISCVAVDWDADGDLDLLLGAKEGRLYLRRNNGKPGAPAFAASNELLRVGPEDDQRDFEVPGGLTAPRVLDWDGDGLFDLLCASFDGGVHLFINSGERGAPLFEDYLTLVADGARRRPGVRPPVQPSRPDRGCYADAVDYDGDGDLDLLVGGYSRFQPEAPALTAAQRGQLADLETELEAFEAELGAYWGQRAEDADDEDVVGAMMKRRKALVDAIDALEPSPREEAFVWLYRRM